MAVREEEQPKKARRAYHGREVNPFDHRLLTPRLRQVQALVAEGLTNPEIAERMKIDVKSVENYVNQVFQHYCVEGNQAARVLVTLAHLAEQGDEIPLEPRRKAVLALIANGLTNEEIAARMNVSDWTVRRYVSQIYAYYGCIRSGSARVLVTLAYLVEQGLDLELPVAVQKFRLTDVHPPTRTM